MRADRDSQGKEQFVPKGLQPVQEKNFAFEMTLSLLLEEGTHRPLVTKCPEPLLPLFAGEQPLVTKKMGRKLRAWAEGGAPAEEDPEVLFKQGTAYAAQGTVAYTDYWETLTGKQKKLLLPKHDENKELARMADDRQKKAEGSASAPGLDF